MKTPSLSRRMFLGAIGIAAPAVEAAESASYPQQRREAAFRVRMEAAQSQMDAALPEQTGNGDEQRYVDRIGNYSKGMPHNDLGEVDPNAYLAFLRALASGEKTDLDSIPLGCPDPALQRKFVNPQAGLAFDLEGADSHHMAIPPAPRLNSAEAAGEMVELYWQALARDVSFAEYGSNSVTLAAASELSGLSDFRGPKLAGRVTPATLFRGFTSADLSGPYLSQFLLKPIPFGPQHVDQRMRTVGAGNDFLTDYSQWLAIQNGWMPRNSASYDSVPRYIRNGRDLAEWVHRDVLFQAYFNASLILLTPPDAVDPITGGGLGAPLNPSNPYADSRNQEGFGTFGGPFIATLVAEVAMRALKAVWYQKWFVHRRLRPEEYGGRVHNLLAGRPVQYAIHREVLGAAAPNQVFSRHGSYLLPQVYPEGCPLHPAYGAGHATVAGACVTILKALFDESYVIPEPVVATPDGLSLTPYRGPDADRLTVGGELNKLAANVGIGRNFAGIHWRSDYAESLRLGEAVAIHFLQDHKLTFHEEFRAFAFTGFDGGLITI